MKAYTLHDIEIFIGAAGNAVCEDKIFPQECDLLIMEISAEISKRLIGHLSGLNPFPEDALKILTVLLKNGEANTMTQDARMRQMLEYLPVEELNPEDIEFLRWISGWGDSTTEKMIRIIRKCRGTSISENEEVNHHEAGKSKVEANLVRRDGDPD